MPNFNSVFKHEVSRLARKEVRDLVGTTKTAVALHRREIAALKKQVAALEKRVAFLERRETKRLTKAPAAAAPGVRFTAKRLKTHRKRLGLSAADYGALVGVTGQTIYNWEGGKGKPSGAKLAAWAAMRDIGVRDAENRLSLLE